MPKRNKSNTSPALLRKPQQAQRRRLFESQLTECSLHRTCDCASPSAHPNENHDSSNIPLPSTHTANTAHTAPRQTHTKTSLRQQIELRLQQPEEAKAGCIQPSARQPLSAIRRMLTQGTPQVREEQKREEESRQAQGGRRAQFEERQRRAWEARQERQEQGRKEQSCRETLECTFRPKLTPYRRL